MTLPNYAPGVNMNVDMIKNEAQRGGQWDINDAVYRRIAGMPSGQISFYDFYGKSFEETMYWDGNTLMNAISNGGGTGWFAANPIDAGDYNWPFVAWIWQYEPPDPGPPPDPVDGGGSYLPTCFLIGSPVVMADGTIKMIEDITIGEWVRGAFGEHNQVLALDRPMLGNRHMYNINGEHQTTGEHNHLTESGLFGCVSLAESQNEKLWTHQEVITDQGVEEWFFSGIQDTSLITQFELGNRLKTTDGYKSLDSMEPLTLAPETQLYNLVLSGSHTYYVQGYCVTGFGHDYDFDYRTWQSKGTSWSADNYRER